jgi:hypothetical protein
MDMIQIFLPTYLECFIADLVSASCTRTESYNVTDSDWFMEKLAELVFCPISSMYYKKMNLLSLVLLLVNNKKNYKMNGGSVTVFFLFLFHMKQANSSEKSVI